MKAIKIVAVAALLATSLGASAQIEKDTKDYNRISFGYSQLRCKNTYDGKKYGDVDTYNGMEVSFIHGINLSKSLPLFLEVGGKLDYNVDREKEDDWKYRENYLSIAVPVNVSYKLSLKNGLYVAPYAGIHFKVNALINEFEKYDGEKERYNEFKHDDDLKRFQFGGGLGVNLGYKFINLGIGYIWDTPLEKDGDYKYKTGTFTTTIGFNL